MKKLIAGVVLLLLVGCADPDPRLSEGTVVGKRYEPTHTVRRTGGCTYRDPDSGICYSYNHYNETVPERFVVVIEGTVTDKDGNAKTYRQERDVYQTLYERCRRGQKWQETPDGVECIAQ